MVLIAAGNAELYPRPGVVTRPVGGLSPAVMALAWRGTSVGRWLRRSSGPSRTR